MPCTTRLLAGDLQRIKAMSERLFMGQHEANPSRGRPAATRSLLLLGFAFAALAVGVASRTALPGSQEEEIDGRTVRSLYEACRVGADDLVSWCEAYLMGVADTLAALGDGSHEAGLCGADDDPKKLAWAFMIWASAHQDRWERDMLAGAQAALRERWPCS
jgi:hypothetical protein